MIPRFTHSPPWAVSLRYRDFRLLWVSTLLYSLGMGMERVAVGWLVFEITDSAFMVGVAAAVQMAPFFFLGILSGAMADWLERRLFLFFSSLAGTAVSVIMAVMLLAGETNVWAVLALVAVGGCVLAFTLTTRLAYTYDIVGPEHALNGLSLNQIGMQAGTIVGAIMSGLLIGAVGPGWQYLAVGASYIVSAAVLLLTGRSIGTVQPRREPVLQNLAGYIRFLTGNRVLLVLMCLASITEVLGFTHMTLLPVFSKDVLHLGPVGLGYLTAMRQAGGLLGLALLANFRDYRKKGLLMFMIAGSFGVGLMAFSISSSLVFFVIVLVVVNACAMSVDTLYKTLMQANVGDEQRGRAMGSWVVSIGVAPVGHLGVGALASLLGAPGALLVNGAMLTGISLAAFIGLPRIRQLE